MNPIFDLPFYTSPYYPHAFFFPSPGVLHDDFVDAYKYAPGTDWGGSDRAVRPTIERSPMSIHRTESCLSDDFIILASSDDRLVRHDSRIAARAEATRLALANPGTNFKIFCEVGIAFKQKLVPGTEYARKKDISADTWNGWMKLVTPPAPKYPRYFVRIKDDNTFRATTANPVIVYHSRCGMQCLVTSNKNAGYEWSPLCGTADVALVAPAHFREVTRDEALSHALQFAWLWNLPNFPGVAV